MDYQGLEPPVLVGREEELEKLKKSLDKAIDRKGSTLFISGEAGIGKTRLVTELMSYGEEHDAAVLKGWCLAENLEPLMPVKSALRDANLLHLITDNPPPLVVSAYLTNEAGMLIAKAEREETGLDSDIFASMLSAVGNFVQDSLSMMEGDGLGSLNSLGYGDYNILIQTSGKLSLAVVIKGSNNEFLVGNMSRTLKELEGAFDKWAGGAAEAREAIPNLSWFIESGQYDGKFLVDDPKIRQENLFDNVLLGIQRVSEERSLIIFIDDMQWADPTSLNLLHYLSRNTRGNRILIIGTYRPEDIVKSEAGKSHQLDVAMQNMSRENLFEKIELERMAPEETVQIITTMLGSVKLDNDFFERLYRESDGTPFFLLETIKMLVADSVIKQDDAGNWELVMDMDNLEIPSKVYDVVKRRLDRLIEQQKEILECASIIGEEFSTEVLEKTVELRKITLLKNLSEIEKTHQLIQFLRDRYRFNHTKVREVLYNGIGEELRKEYHRIIGDTFEEIYSDRIEEFLSEMAHQYLKAGDNKAFDYLTRAGEKAKEKYANEEAIRLFEYALEQARDTGELKSLYENLGDIHSLIGNYETALDYFSRCMELENTAERKARFHRKKSQIYDFKADYDMAKKEFQKGLAQIEGQEIIEKANLLTIQSGILTRTGDFQSSLKLAAEALSIAESLGDARTIAATEQVMGMTNLFKGEFENALPHLERCLKARQEIGDMSGISNTLNNMGFLYRDIGRPDKALEILGQALECVERIGNKQGISASMNNLGLIYRDMGDLDKSLELFEKSLVLAEMVDDRLGIGLRYYNIGEVHRYKQDLEKSFDYLNRAMSLFQEINNTRAIIECHCNLAETLVELGNFQDSLANAAKAVELSTEIGARGLESMSRLTLGTIYYTMGESEKAGQEFDNTLKILEMVGDRPVLAATKYQYGLLYKDMGNIDKARQFLEDAQSMFQEMGMKQWIRKCGDALAGLD